MVAVQIIFHFVFQIIGYSSFLLSVALIVSFLVFITISLSWRILKKKVQEF